MRELEIPKYHRPSTPGDIIRDMFLEEETFGFTQSKVADRLGISRRVFSAILNGERAVTPAMAMRLERVVGLSAGTWLNLQRCVDMFDVLHSPEAKQIAKLKPLVSRKSIKRSRAA